MKKCRLKRNLWTKILNQTLISNQWYLSLFTEYFLLFIPTPHTIALMNWKMHYFEKNIPLGILSSAGMKWWTVPPVSHSAPYDVPHRTCGSREQAWIWTQWGRCSTLWSSLLDPNNTHCCPEWKIEISITKGKLLLCVCKMQWFEQQLKCWYTPDVRIIHHHGIFSES